MINTNQQTCTRCQISYEAKRANLMGVQHDFSGGLCPTCKDKKVSEYSAQVEALRLDAVIGQREKWRDVSGIPPKFYQKRFSDLKPVTGSGFNVNKAKDICVSYAKGFPVYYRQYLKTNPAYKSLLIYSPQVGLGKSHMASSIIHAILEHWNGEGMDTSDLSPKNGLPLKYYCRMTNPVLFVSEPDLYMQIQGTYSYSQEERRYRDSETDILNRLINRDLLVIDDIGKTPRKDMDFVQRTLFAIIDGRYKSLRPVVITTNKVPEELKNYVGEASFDRLIEMCGGAFHQIKGESYRGKV